MKMFGSWLAIASLAIVLGCNKSDPAVNVPGAAPAVEEDAQAKSLRAMADRADVYVQTVINSIADGQAKAVWNALPTKYQADVRGLKDAFAAKMDADVYNKLFVVVGKLSQVLKSKKEMLLQSDMLKSLPQPILDGLSKDWDKIVGVVDAIAQAPIKTIDGLKSTDPGTLLDSAGNLIFSQVLKAAESNPLIGEQVKLRKVKVSLVKLDGDTATLKIETEGEPPPTTDDVFKKVDGKWLPEKMVAEWDAAIEKAKTNLADFEITPEMKKVTLGPLNAVESILDAMLAAPSQAAFDQELAKLVQIGVDFAKEPMQPPTGAPSGTAPLGGPAGVPTLGGPTLGGPAIGTGPGSLPTPGSLPKPSGTITPPTLPPAPTSGASSNGPSLGIPGPTSPAAK